MQSNRSRMQNAIGVFLEDLTPTGTQVGCGVRSSIPPKYSRSCVSHVKRASFGTPENHKTISAHPPVNQTGTFQRLCKNQEATCTSWVAKQQHFNFLPALESNQILRSKRERERDPELQPRLECLQIAQGWSPPGREATPLTDGGYRLGKTWLLELVSITHPTYGWWTPVGKTMASREFCLHQRRKASYLWLVGKP